MTSVHFALIHAYVGKSFKVVVTEGGEFSIGVDCLVLRYGYIFWGGKGERKSIYKLKKRIIPIISNIGSIEHATEWLGSCTSATPHQALPNSKFKKHGFCRYGDVRSYT